ncbi:ArsR family transcriptional regulator [Candidatus Woesearchaeota archaeon]|nr:ArsR family transcriptional regulator [Candidatus Woesearchaeota archaeon]
MFKEINIRNIEKKENNDFNKDIQWLSDSLGLFNLRDKEKSCFRIFLELIKAKKEDKLISSDEIAFNSHLSRGTVIHHLNSLTEKGFVISYKQRYALNSKNVESLVSNLELEINSVIKEIKKTAKEIDKDLNL